MEAPTPPDEPRDRRSASAQVPGNRRASESHLRRMMDAIHLDELVEQTPIAVAVLSTDDRVLLISKQFTRMFGYEPDEVMGRSINDLIVPEPLVAGAREYPGKLEQGQRVEVETVRRRKDGTDVHVLLLEGPVATASGEHVANYAIYRDITERKHVEARLLESEARFRTMADTAPVLIWTTGTDGLCNYLQQTLAGIHRPNHGTGSRHGLDPRRTPG